jgi:hypothetical protein
MQPAEAEIAKFRRLGRRIAIVDRRLLHRPALQPNAFAVLEVDGGKKNHEPCSE